MDMRDRRVRHSLGKRLVDGPQLRTAPPIEGVWISTFSLRWWQYAEREHETAPSPGRARRRETVVESTF
jgi:hypothetical protein